MWGAIIQAIDNVANRINKGAGAGIEVAKSQNGGAAGSGGNSGTTDTTMFGKSLKTVVSKIKDDIKNNQNKEEKNGTEETEGTI